MRSLFRLEGGLFHPLPFAASPGAVECQSSAAVAGLLAREIELATALAPLWLARLTVEAPRAVPMAPVATRTRVLRDGKQLQLIQAELTIDGELFADAIGLRVRKGDSPYDAAAPHGLGGPDAVSGAPPFGVFGHDGPTRIRMVGGPSYDAFAYWALCEAGLVEGESATTVVRAVMACDAAAAMSRNARGEAACPGVDLSLYLARAPSGGWILAQNEAEHADPSCGLVSSLLSDSDGAFGYAHQTLLYAHAAD
ncbi:MAG TPA: acyl-CoA thioesterase domain-containing protein [Caulobacteraceae bacterium]|nr:acyl-CoA thioesterase domain-containing protein [Caulobacteraceae bacterium]